MAIVSLLFITTLLSVFVTGILMLLVLTKRNRLQKTLAAILGVFSIMMFVGMINMAQSSNHIYAVLSSPFRFRFLVLGLIAFFAAMTYYMVAAHRNLLTIRNGIIFLSPVLITLVVYAVWHLRTGVPMDYPYASLAEIWENRYTVPVILRLLMYLFFLIYQGVMIHNMWHLDSLRSKHSILNSPDAVSNIRWLRMVVVGIMLVLIVYSLLIFIPSIIMFLFYVIVTASVFIYFIYNALARRMYEDTEGWQATWTLHGGWKVVETKPTSEPMLNTDIHSQTNIRRFRIEEACRIIRCEKNVKVHELALRVGFSHTSSFCRAFTAVMNETVIQYMDRVGGKRIS